MRLVTRFIGSIAFTIIEVCAFVLVVVGTPIEQFEQRWSVGAGCYTLFAFKQRCHQLHATHVGTAAFACVERRNYMIIAAVFAVISIVLTLTTVVFGVLMLLRISCAVFIPLVLTCVSVATITVSWACLAVVYNQSMCGSRSPFKVENQYGAGFGLLVTAFCLQVINVILLFVLVFA